MGHREDLLAGAVRCLREKGYGRTTARDIVAASGTNLASIGYHYGSTQALLNAAVFQAMEDFGAEIQQVMRADADPPDAPLERFEDGRSLWARAIYGLDPDDNDHAIARAVGSLHQALLSGALVQWLIDPD